MAQGKGGEVFAELAGLRGDEHDVSDLWREALQELGLLTPVPRARRTALPWLMTRLAAGEKDLPRLLQMLWPTRTGADDDDELLDSVVYSIDTALDYIGALQEPSEAEGRLRRGDQETRSRLRARVAAALGRWGAGTSTLQLWHSIIELASSCCHLIASHRPLTGRESRWRHLRRRADWCRRWHVDLFIAADTRSDVRRPASTRRHTPHELPGGDVPTPLTPRRPSRSLLTVTAVLLAAGGLALWNALPPSPPAQTAELPLCPAISPGQGQLAPTSSSCLFSDAAAQHGAELVVTSLTTEGDPIRTHYRKLPGQPGLEVLVDSTEDEFGSGAWQQQTCPEASSLRDLGTCTTSP